VHLSLPTPASSRPAHLIEAASADLLLRVTAKESGLPLLRRAQDEFVSHTAKEEQEAEVNRIIEEKSRSEVGGAMYAMMVVVGMRGQTRYRPSHVAKTGTDLLRQLSARGIAFLDRMSPTHSATPIRKMQHNEHMPKPRCMWTHWWSFGWLFLFCLCHFGRNQMRVQTVGPTSRVQVTNPLEPLIVGLIKGYINDSDLSAKLSDLYQASRAAEWGPKSSRQRITKALNLIR
jgi:hypothetical protein